MFCVVITIQWYAWYRLNRQLYLGVWLVGWGEVLNWVGLLCDWLLSTFCVSTCLLVILFSRVLSALLAETCAILPLGKMYSDPDLWHPWDPDAPMCGVYEGDFCPTPDISTYPLFLFHSDLTSQLLQNRFVFHVKNYVDLFHEWGEGPLLLESGVKIFAFLVSLQCCDALLRQPYLVGLGVHADKPHVKHAVRPLLPQVLWFIYLLI